MPNTSLVTGGAGFIGAHVVRELLAMGDRVIVLDDLSGGFEENLPQEVTFIKGSILDYKLIDRIFNEYKFDHVYHLAAYAAEGLSHFIKRFNYNNNLVGSVNLINASVNFGVKCFVFTSSIAVYGAAQLPMSEDTIPQPEDSYGISKYAVEQELKVSHEMFGLNYVIFRPHNVYGEFQNIGDRYRNVIGIFMNQIMQNQPLTIFGDGTQSRAFSYISEISGTIAKAAITPNAFGEVFNVGADTPYSVNELADVVANCFGVKANINYLEARNEVLHAYSSHEKVKQYFPVPTPVTLVEGIERMARWAKVHGPRKSSEFGEIEIEKNLPASWKLPTK
jgi:UDP-glucose 4-epimerase